MSRLERQVHGSVAYRGTVRVTEGGDDECRLDEYAETAHGKQLTSTAKVHRSS